MKVLDLAILFFAIILVVFLAIAMVARIEKPASGTTEYEVWTNLTAIVSILFTTWSAILLILLMVVLIAAVALLGRGNRGW